MNNISFEFNRQLELDVLINNLTKVTFDYTSKRGYNKVDEVIIPEGVTSIWDYAFEYCHHLTGITIPNSVTSIGYMAFYDCWRLTSVTIPNSVTSIGGQAFRSCDSLTRVTFEGKTLEEVRSMKNYPWDISPEKIVVQVSRDLI